MACLLVTSCTGDAVLARATGGDEASAGGLRVALDAERGARPHVVRLRLRISDSDGGGPYYRVDYGDGTHEEVVEPAVACLMPAPRAGGPSSAVPRPVDRVVVLQHAYDRAGSYAVVVRVVSGRPCAEPPETWDGRLDLDLA